MKLAEIAAALGAELVGDGEIDIAQPVATGRAEAPDDLEIAFTTNRLAGRTRGVGRAGMVAADVDVPEGLWDGYIAAAEPREALARLLDLFERPVDGPPGIHPAADIDPTATVAGDAAVGAFVRIGPRSVVGPGTRILSHVTIGADVRIGAGCLIYSGARIGDRTLVGDRTILHYNTVLGNDGFSFLERPAPSYGQLTHGSRADNQENPNRKINSIGWVEIGDDVEIGANTAVARGTLGPTRIGSRTKIDMNCSVAHNCELGENCVLMGDVALAGSVTVGRNVIFNGGAGVADHITIGNGAIIGPRAGVAQDVPDQVVVHGSPAQPVLELVSAMKATNPRRLGKLYDDVRALKRQLADLIAAKEKNTD